MSVPNITSFLLLLWFIGFVACYGLGNDDGHLSFLRPGQTLRMNETREISNGVTGNNLGAIYMLVSNWKTARPGRSCYFNCSMDALVSNWRPHNSYPVILMETRPWSRQDVAEIRQKWPMLDFKFINVADIFKSVPKLAEADFEDSASPLSSVNYKRMCHFFIKGFTQVPLLMKYKYLLRLDDDTCIQDSIEFDVFRALQHENAAYAYTHVWKDGKKVTKGLYAFINHYVQLYKLQWKNPALHESVVQMKHFPRVVPCFNTNFEVINTVRYRDAAVMKFVDTVVASNMIFHRRWGDAPLRLPMVSLFWTEKEIVRLEGFEVQHSSWAPFPTVLHSHTSNPTLISQ